MLYEEARVYLDHVSKYGSVLGLDTIRGLLRELGNPQDDLKFIHIAGTNGKGSVLAYTSTILSEAGYRTGRYVSPTVISYLERIQIDGTWIPEDEFAELTENVKEAIARMEAAGEESPTVFEAETAIAFLYFKKKNVIWLYWSPVLEEFWMRRTSSEHRCVQHLQRSVWIILV